MALKTQPVEFRISGGIKEASDQKLVEPPNALEVANGRFTTEGKIIKRLGRLEKDPTNKANWITTPSQIMPDGDGGFVITGDSAGVRLNHSTGLTEETTGAHVTACDVESRRLAGGASDDHSHSGAYDSATGLACYAYTSRTVDSSGSERYYVFVQVSEVSTGAVVFGPAPMSTDTTCPHSEPRVVAHDGGFWVFGRDGYSAASPLRYARVTITAGVPSLGTIGTLSAYDFRAYDVLTITGSDAVTAVWVTGITTNAEEIYLAKCSRSGTSLSATADTFTAPAVPTTRCKIAIGYSSVDNRVVAVAHLQAANATLTGYYSDDVTPLIVGGASFSDVESESGNIGIIEKQDGTGDLWLIATSFDATTARCITGIWTIDSVTNTSGVSLTFARYSLSAKPVLCAPGGDLVVFGLSYTEEASFMTLQPHQLLVTPFVNETADVPGSVVSELVLRVIARFNADRAAVPFSEEATSGYPTRMQTAASCFAVGTSRRSSMLYVPSTVIANTDLNEATGRPAPARGGVVYAFNMSPSSLRRAEHGGGRWLSSGGLPYTWDGARFAENSLHSYPEIVTSTGGGGATEKYRFTWEVVDSSGNLHRSAPSPEMDSAIAHSGAVLTITPPPPSMFFGSLGTRIVLCVYRTYNLTGGDTTYYLIRKVVPETLTGGLFVFTDNAYHYTAGGKALDEELEPYPPPPLSDVCSDGQRIYGVSADDDSYVVASKELKLGYAPEFNPALGVQIPGDGGRTIAVESMDEKVIVFKEGAIYYFTGPGPSNTGVGSFSEVRQVTHETGCSSRNSIQRIPEGIVFKGARGVYVLDRGLTLRYIGLPVEMSMAGSVYASLHVPSQTEVRWYLDDTRAVVWNYMFDQWSVWNNETAYRCQSAALIDGVPYTLDVGATDKKILYDDASTYTDDGEEVVLSITTPWLRLAKIGGFQRVRRLLVEGRHGYSGSDDAFRIAVYYNFSDTLAYSTTFLGTELATAPKLKVSWHLPRQKCDAIKFRFLEVGSNIDTSGFDISAYTLLVGVKAGEFKHLREGYKR